ncbi:uncharacterized protein LOC115623955 isoform X2 [Scaptodrosophila lebanonensis]|uniref:Uncharacterized protein LOC115623955 isoform X2 n=1 Tax=Drosophila lebanonensis TaxID=7225 RepID=A0A6J2TG17_DROLE|nr:uncharacterized protein LOC115623955 isoform X2 [Scaptodrosophila lebanonensis]
MAANNNKVTTSTESCDEVDFVATHNNNNNNNNNNDYDDYSISNLVISNNKTVATTNNTNAVRKAIPNNEPNATNNNNNNTNTLKKSKGRRTLFTFGKKANKSQATSESSTMPSKSTPHITNVLLLPPAPLVPIGTPPRTHKFVKSNSIARLLGNTYNAKKFEKQEQKRLANEASGKFNTFGGRRHGGSAPYLERFKRMSKEDGDIAGSDDTVTVTNMVTLTTDSRDLYGGSRNEHVARELLQNDDLSVKAMRTLSRGLGKLWWKRTHSVDISTPDPEFKVSYLGNVLTGWAKGEGCVEKQLNTLWRNYTQHTKPDVIMRIKVCASGLKATTRQHGLTEYWANRITYCCAPKNYPRVFCWIYRHEGRKLKHELRCHAVLCSKEKIAQDISDTLRENLESALREFKREKILKQNARLSLANAVYDNPSLPRRKIMLSVGGNNYRPPLERSKSAPKLMAIEEAIGEEEGDEIEDTNEPEMKSCCQRDSLYPAMTLGRRRCRRGHSIRRTGKIQSVGCCQHQPTVVASANSQPAKTEPVAAASAVPLTPASDGSDSDDFEKLLKFNDYDTSTTLSTELLPYFDMQLHKNNSQSLGSLSELKQQLPQDESEYDEEQPLSLLPTINSDPSADPQADYDTEELGVSLRRNGICSDGEEEDYLDDAEDHYFRQAALLNMLHRNSMRKMNTNLGLSSDECGSSLETTGAQYAQHQYRHQQQSSISSNASCSTTSSSSGSHAAVNAALSAAQEGSAAVANESNAQKLHGLDSDEGSISSGCETASTVTNANHEELAHKYKQRLSISSALEDSNNEQVLAEIMYQRLELRNNSDATNYSSSSSITLKLNTSPASSLNGLDVVMVGNGTANSGRTVKRTRKQQQRDNGNETDDSECSDESGYVEYQERERAGTAIPTTPPTTAQGPAMSKPQLPPKPMPRRSLTKSATGTAV